MLIKPAGTFVCTYYDKLQVYIIITVVS